MSAPYMVVLRRKPSKKFHVLLWNTKSDQIISGSWFTGKLYPKRCDISFDGKWMVYFAMGSGGKTWNGVCRLPSLKTIAEGDNGDTTYFGGGYWRDEKTLLVNGWEPRGQRIPFRVEPLVTEWGGEDLGVLIPRVERDGWIRAGDNYGRRKGWKNVAKPMVDQIGDDGWLLRPTPEHPALRTRYLGYLEHGYTFRFQLEGFPNLLDEQVDWACWDSTGALIFSRLGIVSKCDLADLMKGRVTRSFNLELLEPGRRWQDIQGSAAAT
ncbi:MAG: hypothetical protein SYC29_02500 [Planctomycetota bacterium]|nr:hypothetical protein [Planctomycetota bacterium]